MYIRKAWLLGVLIPILEARPISNSQNEIDTILIIINVLLYSTIVISCISSGLYIYYMNNLYSLEDKPMTKLKQRSCRHWFKHINKIGMKNIRLEFTGQVKSYNPKQSMKAFNDQKNQSKNRYDDVFLLDKTRVKVKLNPHKDDYIHASYVEVFDGLTYICAQGPLENTICQFWLMCIQEDVKVILQLCQNIEDNEDKCSDYLPTRHSWSNFGWVQIKILEDTVAVRGAHKLTKTVIMCKFKNKETTITHLLYAGWPDRSNPSSASTCVKIRKLVRRLCERDPIVVHCSAGIGRTGTFVAVEMACHKILNELEPTFDMVELVKDLRDKRMHAVQNNIQYIFIYRCIIEILISEQGLAETKDVKAFINEYEELVARKVPKKRPKPPPSTTETQTTTRNLDQSELVSMV